MDGSRITPSPRATCDRPASNWGLINATTPPPRAGTPAHPLYKKKTGNPACGSAQVGADITRYVEVKPIQGGFQFLAAARDVARPTFNLDFGVGKHRRGGLEHQLAVYPHLAGHPQPLRLGVALRP